MPPTSTRAAGARTLWLVRHGESTWNTLGLTQGHNDQAELTDRGKRQAAEVADRLGGLAVRAIYTSDLRRAQQTAAPLAAASGLPVVLDQRLRERNLGVLEGTPVAGNGPSATGLDLGAGLLVNPDTRPGGGESVRDLYQRAAAFVDDLRAGVLPGGSAALSEDDPPGPWPATSDYARRSDAGEVSGAVQTGHCVVVAHGGTLRVLRAYLSGVPVERMDWAPLANATVLEFPDFDATQYSRVSAEGER